MGLENGRGDWIRTSDIPLPNQDYMIVEPCPSALLLGSSSPPVAACGRSCPPVPSVLQEIARRIFELRIAASRCATCVRYPTSRLAWLFLGTRQMLGNNLTSLVVESVQTTVGWLTVVVIFLIVPLFALYLLVRFVKWSWG